jgi:hypothetical protein
VTFGKQGGGGRRNSNRKAASLLAVVKTRATSYSAELVDISLTGAKLRGAHLPNLGEEFFVAIERLEVFASVVWSEQDECGIAFDEPISSFQLNGLQIEAKTAKLMRLTPAEKQALDHWRSGRID